MATRYETGLKAEVLRSALHCAIRDREGMLDSLTGSFTSSQGGSREKALASLSPCDRTYYLEIEATVRDFNKLLSSIE